MRDRQTIDVAFRFAPTDEGIITGHAAIFGEENRHGEIVAPGAFARTLREHRKLGILPPMLRAHDQRDIIGVWTEMKEDATGLAVSGELIRETASGADVFALMRRGALNGLSIGFVPRNIKRGPGGMLIITEIELVEVSIVAIPSAKRARAKVRSSDDLSAFAAACRRAATSIGRVHR